MESVESLGADFEIFFKPFHLILDSLLFVLVCIFINLPANKRVHGSRIPTTIHMPSWEHAHINYITSNLTVCEDLSFHAYDDSMDLFSNCFRFLLSYFFKISLEIPI